MCTSIMHKGSDLIVGFNLDTDIFDYKINIKRTGVFYVSLMYYNKWQPAFGVNQNGIFVTELMNPECERGKYKRSPKCFRLDLLLQNLLFGKTSWDETINILKEKNIVNLPCLSLHSHITDKNGNVIIVEPGRGYALKSCSHSVMTNFSLFEPLNTVNIEGTGKERFCAAESALENAGENFSVNDAFEILKSVSQNGKWTTVFSMVYSANQNKIYYAEKQNYGNIKTHSF